MQTDWMNDSLLNMNDISKKIKLLKKSEVIKNCQDIFWNNMYYESFLEHALRN